ncbi:MAG: NAD(P)-binding domain-containing protein [Myxococcales bacterium]|nr:NAD(P)-binding domain-containing protein [Myxococcales bacterium]
MAILVPLVLGGLALAVMAIVSVQANRKSGRQPATAGQARFLIHAINDDRCTGCDACVAVCPTNVLDLVSNKSRVLRFQDCIQCEACMWACPTEALVMFPEGTQPPPVRAPNIDDHYQTAIPGQYLIGEVAGKPLVKNAANLGRAVIEHMLQTGLRATPGTAGDVDVLIVGSGPGGLSAALTCQQQGVSYVVIEKENIISSTVSRYPKGKHVMAEPYETQNLSLLPVFDSTKEELVALWQELVDTCGIQIRLHETVQIVQKQQDGSFMTATTGGHYRSQRVVLATGTRGKPRTLGVPGENFPKVLSLLEDPNEHSGRSVCVVGGGDSALEAALALSDAGAKVIMSYRGRSFHRAQAKNRQRVEQGAAQGRLKVKLQSEITEFGEDTVTLQIADGTQERYPNQAAFVLIGADPPVKWLGTLGVYYTERPHMQPMPASDAMVRQFVPYAQDCPVSASEAVAQVFGRAVTERPTHHSERSNSRESSRAGVGRRFVRSASNLFGIGDESKKGMSLSDFAESGTGIRRQKRDDLTPSERTRILRMLRDEGGRHANEDSKVHRVDELIAGYQTNERSMGHEESEVEYLATQLLPISDSAAPAEPKQAVIVGLAKAANERKTRAAFDPPVEAAFDPEEEEERTAHLSPEEAQLLMSRSGTSNPFAEEATSFADFDAAAMMAQVDDELGFADDSLGDEEATRVAFLVDEGITPPLTIDEESIDVDYSRNPEGEGEETR